MEMSKAALGIVAAVCVAAGAGGVYVATRTGQAVPATTQQVSETATPSAATAGVEQSEGVVNDAPEAQASAPVPAAPAATSKPARSAAPERTETTRPRSPRPSRAAASAAPSTPAASPAPARDDQAAAAAPLDSRSASIEPARQPAPPEPQYYDLVIPAESVIGLQVDTPVSSDTARVEDRVTARVTRDVKVGDHVAVPAGSRAQGEVTLVERGGRLKDRARLGVRFTSIVLADGTRVPIDTEAIYREGDNPAPASAAKIGGGAIGGAIIGGIFGGAKGAIIGSTIGGGAGTAATMAGGRSPATLSAGAPVTVRLQQSATVTVEKE